MNSSAPRDLLLLGVELLLGFVLEEVEFASDVLVKSLTKELRLAIAVITLQLLLELQLKLLVAPVSVAAVEILLVVDVAKPLLHFLVHDVYWFILVSNFKHGLLGVDIRAETAATALVDNGLLNRDRLEPPSRGDGLREHPHSRGLRVHEGGIQVQDLMPEPLEEIPPLQAL